MTEFKPFHFEKKCTHQSTGAVYKVEVGDFLLTDKQGNVEASIYSYSYIPEGHKGHYPVLFAYNGGPGASSSWVHMGFLGPKIVTFPGFPEENCKVPAEYNFGENPDFLVDCCSIVLINPPGTYQTMITDAGREKYFSPAGDAQAVARFIQDWLEKHDCTDAPVYLLGESYGTLRSIYVADILPEYIDLRGIISIGTSFNVGSGKTLPVEPNVRRLGADAAACWYHKHRQEQRDMREFVREAMDFAYGDYAHALLMGNRLPAENFETVLEKLHYYSGLDKNQLREGKLRFTEMDFLSGLCPGQLISAYDARISRPLAASMTEDEWNQAIHTEPFMQFADPAVDACLKIYTKELAEPAEIRPTTDFLEIAMNWDFAKVTMDPMDLPEKLMKRRPGLRFMFVAGYYDLQSTFDFVTYYLSQHEMPRDRIVFQVYPSGHAAYMGDGDAAVLCKDIRTFICDEGGKEK